MVNGRANDNARHSAGTAEADVDGSGGGSDDDESILRARWRYAIPEIYETVAASVFFRHRQRGVLLRTARNPLRRSARVSGS